VTGLHGESLDAWIAGVGADGFPHLHSFTAGLKRDHAASDLSIYSRLP
jgi:hypothetical protein